jgi:uncharacterized membrane protein
MKTALLLGCSTITHKTYLKGIDSFTQTEHSLGGVPFKAALQADGWEVTHVPAHEIDSGMPQTLEELLAYSVVVISDVGSNTFLLSPTTRQARFDIDRLGLIAEYVKAGGALLLVGGYFSFSGIDAKARFGSTALAPILPVEILSTDDRIEHPAGIVATVTAPQHPVMDSITGEWPALLGYNRTILRDGGEQLVGVGPDPLLAVRRVGQGRVATFASDFAPHWAPAEFLEWDGYATLWHNLLGWLAASGE